MLRLGNRQWNYLCAADWSLPGFELYLKKKLYICNFWRKIKSLRHLAIEIYQEYFAHQFEK